MSFLDGLFNGGAPNPLDKDLDANGHKVKNLAAPVDPNDAARLVDVGVGAVSSVFGRTGAVVPASGDYVVAQVTGAVPNSRRVTSGVGLDGGGDLTTDRSLSVVFGTTSGSSAQGNDSRLSDARTPTTHATTHQHGGSDEISVTGLTGVLGTAQTPAAHKTTHQHGGSDEIATATPAANAIPKAGGAGTVAAGWLPAGTTSVAGAVQLEDSTSSTSTSMAATSNAVKSALDLAKAYADALAQGLAVKGSVLVASSSNVAVLSGIATTIDGTLVSTPGTRIGLLGQSTASKNGIWVIQIGAWTRPTDFATGSHAAGTFFFVESGTANSGSGWTCNTTTNDVVDTDNLSFTQFSGAGEVTAGTALSKSGNTLDVVLGTSGASAAAGNDSRLSDARTPTAHATSHKSGGSDAIALDTLATPTDITTLNASSSAHGLMPKADGNAAHFYCSDGTQKAPPGTTVGIWFPEAKPGSISSQSDYFDAGSLDAKWLTWDPGSGVLTKTLDTTRKMIKLGGAGNGSVRFSGIAQPIPGSEFAFFVKLGVDYKLSAAGASAGIFVSESVTAGSPAGGTAKFASMDRIVTTSTNILRARHAASYTSSTTNDATQSQDAAWLSMRLNGTTVSCDFSVDGLEFQQLFTGTLAFTPTHYGLIVESGDNAQTVTGTYDLFLSFDGAGTSVRAANHPGAFI